MKLGDVAPLGWLALNTAHHVPGARQNSLLPRMAEALAPRGGAAAKAAAQLQLLLAPAQPAASGAVGMEVDAAPAVVAVEDLLHCAGGRHDNDKEDFRSVQLLVTSDEVCLSSYYTLFHYALAVCLHSLTAVQHEHGRAGTDSRDRPSRPDPNVAHLWAMLICWWNDWLKSDLYL